MSSNADCAWQSGSSQGAPAAKSSHPCNCTTSSARKPSNLYKGHLARCCMAASAAANWLQLCCLTCINHAESCSCRRLLLRAVRPPSPVHLGRSADAHTCAHEVSRPPGPTTRSSDPLSLYFTMMYDCTAHTNKHNGTARSVCKCLCHAVMRQQHSASSAPELQTATPGCACLYTQ